MGSFDKTCCASNTSISAGEQCLIIILNKNTDKDFYELRRQVYGQSKRKKENQFKLVGFEIDEVKDMSSNLNKGYFLPIKDVVIGEYNSYGSIEEEEKLPKDYEDYRMYHTEFYHIWAIEYLLIKPIDELIKDKLKLVSDLYIKMNWLRKSPIGMSLSGQQHKDIEEMEDIRNFNGRIDEYLKNTIREHRSWEEEEDNK